MSTVWTHGANLPANLSTVPAGGGDVLVWGMASWYTLCPLIPWSIVWTQQTSWELLLTRGIPVWPQLCRLIMSTSGLMMRQSRCTSVISLVTRPDFNRDGVEGGLKGSWQICSNCAMQSYPRGAESARNVSNILRNRDHEELRLFWEQVMLVSVNWSIHSYPSMFY